MGEGVLDIVSEKVDASCEPTGMYLDFVEIRKRSIEIPTITGKAVMSKFCIEIRLKTYLNHKIALRFGLNAKEGLI